MSLTKIVQLGEVPVTDGNGKDIGVGNLIAFSRWKVSRIRVCGKSDINITEYPLTQWLEAFVNGPSPKKPFCFDKLGTEIGLGAPGFVDRKIVVDRIQQLLTVKEFAEVHAQITEAKEFASKL